MMTTTKVTVHHGQVAALVHPADGRIYTLVNGRSDVLWDNIPLDVVVPICATHYVSSRQFTILRLFLAEGWEIRLMNRLKLKTDQGSVRRFYPPGATIREAQEWLGLTDLAENVVSEWVGTLGLTE